MQSGHHQQMGKPAAPEARIQPGGEPGTITDQHCREHRAGFPRGKGMDAVRKKGAPADQAGGEMRGVKRIAGNQPYKPETHRIGKQLPLLRRFGADRLAPQRFSRGKEFLRIAAHHRLGCGAARIRFQHSAP